MGDRQLSDLRTGRGHLWLRIGVPIGGVLLVIAAILAITLYADRVNRAGVLMLSNDLLTGLEAQIAQQVSDYLEPATRAAMVARDMAGQNAAELRDVVPAFATSALRHIPQIDAFYV